MISPSSFTHIICLPGQRFAQVEEAAGGAVIGQGGERDGGFRAFFQREVAARVHIRLDRTGVGEIDFDGCVFEIFSLRHSQHIQSGFGGAVRRQGELRRNLPGGVCGQRT